MNMQQIQAASELANLLYDFMPANPHPYADASVSFPGCATKVGLGKFWNGGSKRPALTALLQKTLENDRGKFCPLMIEIVKTAIPYRLRKNNPITKEEMVEINKKIAEIGFKIPELWDNVFLTSLPTKTFNAPNNDSTSKSDNEILMKEYMALSALDPLNRGFAFEKFLNRLFEAHSLSPRNAFRITGEQIDGSFELESQTYLLEAKWQAKPSGQDQLLVFNGKVEGKSTWARGLFVSYIGFTDDGLTAFAKGKRTSIIGMNGTDIFYILQGKISLINAIKKKARRSVETNDFFVSIHELI
jgi:hypothetical protein